MIIDPIGDSIVRIKNIQANGKKDIMMPFSKFRLAFCQILLANGFVKNVKVEEKKEIAVTLGERIIEFRRISRGGQRIYAKVNEIKRPRTMGGMIIVSTPDGLITGKQARQKHLGGELICEVN